MKNTCFKIEGSPVYLIGVNYWPRDTGPLMWSKWNPDNIKKELIQMKDTGMNVCRSFLYFPDFMPEPDTVDKKMLERFKEFLKLCDDVNFYTIPSLFVGHMSGEDWDVPWREGKNFYSDPWMLKQEILYAGNVAEAGKDSKAIIGWLLSNEITNYAGVSDAETVNNWIFSIYNAIRKYDKVRPISVGDGVWGRELYGIDNGFRLNEQKETIDFIGPHIYLYEDDSLRHSCIPSFTIKLCEYGLPILLQEFGCSNCYASEKHQADYYRTTYHSSFLAGAVGTLCWCYSDFNLQYQRPYSHHAHELFFGITRSDGSVKPAGDEIKRFSKLMDKIDLTEYSIIKDNASIIIPTYFPLDYPYSQENKNIMRKVFLEAYTLSKQAHLNVDFLREPELSDEIEQTERWNIDGDSVLLIAPNLQKLTVPFWNAIFEWVEQGGTFYCSYHYDMWIHIFRDLFGAEHNLRFGVHDIPENDMVEIIFQKAFHGIESGEKFTFRIQSHKLSEAYCPVIPEGAEVIAEDKKGKPAILLNNTGKGRVVFSTYPLEYYLSMTPEVHKKDSTYLIYRALARLAGLKTLFSTDNPGVEIGILENEDRYVLWIINHTWERTSGFINTELDFEEVLDFETDEEIITDNRIPYRLKSKQVCIFQVKVKTGEEK